MNTITLVKALALAALATGAAHAQSSPYDAPALLQNAVISASYNGEAAGMLALDHDFGAGPGANITRLDPTGTGVEFLTSDFLFGVDFSATGGLTVIANGPIPTGAYGMRFDFGASLAAPIVSFTFVGADGASGVPVLTIVNDHIIALDLGAVQWDGFGAFTAQLGAAAPVPEPSGAAMMLAGLAGMAWLQRRRRRVACPARLPGVRRP